jgi:hypothetical protein
LPTSIDILLKTYGAIFSDFDHSGTAIKKSSIKGFVVAALQNPSLLDSKIEEDRQLYLESISNGRNRADGFRDRAGNAIRTGELAILLAKADAFVNARLLYAANTLIKMEIRTTLLSNQLKKATETAFRLGFKFETPEPPG